MRIAVEICGAMARPSPIGQIRLVSVRTVRGANFWSARPVTRLDVTIGAYEEISSADVPGATEALLAALPGLMEHRCSVGTRGGFVERLRRGTYAPHIMEHVGLELQSMAGHDVGYGRARGGDRPGEYTVVVEHRHAAVGFRAAALAFEMVQQLFAGGVLLADLAIAELRSIAETPDHGALQRSVLCGLTGGDDLTPVSGELVRRGIGGADVLEVVSPSDLLENGLPYARSATAIIMNSRLTDVPERYRELDPARRLMAVAVDAVPIDALVIVPASDPELHTLIRSARRRVAVFCPPGESGREGGDLGAVDVVARGVSGRITIETVGRVLPAGKLTDAASVEAQLAAALAVHAIGPEFHRTQKNVRL
jgi:hypothetical protein